MNTSSADSGVLLVHKKWRDFRRQHKIGMFYLAFICNRLQNLMHRRIGIILLPVYGVILVCLSVLLALGKVSGDISIMFALLTVFGFTCAELGVRIPGLRQIGGPVIVTIFLPACLVHYTLLPNELVESINGFWQSTKILYLFIACVIVGSILSMDRRTLTTGAYFRSS